MAQDGQIYRVGKVWMLRYRKPVLVDGRVVRKRCAKKLADYDEVKYRTRADVQPLADKILAPINAGLLRAEATTSVKDFFEKQYLPGIVGKLRPATVDGYQRLWNVLKDHCPDMALADVETVDIQKWMNAACAERQRAHTVTKALKVLLSAGFKFALQSGAIKHNPVRDAAIVRGTPKEDRPAYSLDEFVGMLKVLSEPARTVVLVGGLLGLRRSEMQGLRWEDFAGDEVMIQHSVWNGIVSETKTLASRASLPVVPFLTAALEEHKARNSGTGYVFHNVKGGPVRLANLVETSIRPTLKAASIVWRGFHPLRYGVATILHSLGVDGKIIQQIMRHANIQTTMQFYVKPPASERQAAMAKLEDALGKRLAEKIA